MKPLNSKKPALHRNELLFSRFWKHNTYLICKQPSLPAMTALHVLPFFAFQCKLTLSAVPSTIPTYPVVPLCTNKLVASDWIEKAAIYIYIYITISTAMGSRTPSQLGWWKSGLTATGMQTDKNTEQKDWADRLTRTAFSGLHWRQAEKPALIQVGKKLLQGLFFSF